MQKEIKKNPNHLICIRNAKKETKKDPIHLSYLHSKCKKEIKSYLHKKVIKNNSKSSNLHMKCKIAKRNLKKIPKKIPIVLFAYEMQKRN